MGEKSNIIITRQIFLKLMAIAYLISFLGLFRQLQVLWGDNGLLPGEDYLHNYEQKQTEFYNFWNFPSLHLYRGYFHLILTSFLPFLKVFSAFENLQNLLCLTGIVISLSLVVSVKTTYNSFGFGLLWYLHLNFVLVGQQFTQTPWDLILLEAGFLAIFFAPYSYAGLGRTTIIEEITYYLIRFLAFRITIENGIGKIIAPGNMWPNFNAALYYFSSHTSTTSAGFLIHSNLPVVFKKACACFYLVVEIYLPLTYFSPRRLRVFTGIITFFTQMTLILCVNRSILNLLLIAINFSNFDDKYFRNVLSVELLTVLFVENEAETVPADTSGTTPGQSKLKDEDIQRLLKSKYSKRSSQELFSEILIFANFFVILLVFIYLFLFPLNKIMSGEVTFSKSSLKIYLNPYVQLFYLLSIVFFSFIVKFFLKMQETNYKLPAINPSSFGKNFLFLFFFVFYVVASLNAHFSAIKIIIPNVYVQKYSEAIRSGFNTFRIVNSYTYEQTEIQPYHKDLMEVQFLVHTEWESLSFRYRNPQKVSPFFTLINPFQLRIEYAFDNLKTDKITEVWVLRLINAFIKQNPVLLSGLGYQPSIQFDSRQYMIVERLFDSLTKVSNQFNYFEIHAVRILLYKYRFNTAFEHSKTREVWHKEFKREILPYTTQPLVESALKRFNLSVKSNKESVMHPSQYLPMFDIVVIAVTCVVLRKIFFSTKN